MRIPQKAKKVFEGIIYEVFHWEEKLSDGSTATYEGLKRPNSATVIGVRSDQQIILGRQKQPALEPVIGFLGGQIDEGEKPLEAAKREFLEESGYESDDWELLKVFELPGRLDWREYFYVARNCKKTSEQQFEQGEQIELMLVEFDELLEIICRDDFRNNLEALEILRLKEKAQLEEFKKKLF